MRDREGEGSTCMTMKQTSKQEQTERLREKKEREEIESLVSVFACTCQYVGFQTIRLVSVPVVALTPYGAVKNGLAGGTFLGA